MLDKAREEDRAMAKERKRVPDLGVFMEREGPAIQIRWLARDGVGVMFLVDERCGEIIASGVNDSVDVFQDTAIF